MSTKKVTFADIADYTNFSKTTISRYFNNPDSLTVENQELIRKALHDLNYKENKLAKALANGKSEFVGIVLPTMFLHYYTEVLNQILQTYEKNGYKFLVLLGTDNEETERAYIDELMSFQIEGLVVLNDTLSSKELSNYDIPIVCIEREDEFINSVNTNNYSGAVKATKHLIDCGCDMLIHFNTIISENTPAYERITGFENTCIENNVEYLVVQKSFENNYEELTENVTQLYNELEEKYFGRKKGVFFSNDTYANAFLNLLFRKHGKLPDDYYIVGFDDSPIATEGIIPITTVGQKIGTITAEAMELLVELMNEKKKRVPKPQKELIHKQVEPTLVVRETTTKK